MLEFIDAETTKTARETVDALHAIQSQSMGHSQGAKSRIETMGNRKNHRADVEGSTRRRQERIRGRIRNRKGGNTEGKIFKKLTIIFF